MLGSSYFSLDQIITEENETWLISDPCSSMEECITVSTRKRLPDIGDIGKMRDGLHQCEFFYLSFLYKCLLEFE